MKRLYLPLKNIEQWKALLPNPEKQWKTGNSARALAFSWHEANGIPDEVKRVLSPCLDFHDVEALIMIPEHKVALPGSGHSSQNDLWLLAKSNHYLVSIAVEGKVSESFGCTLDKWLKDASDNRHKRLTFLQETLCVEIIPPHIRYQLIHRTVSALIEAKRFCASHAVMLVHSFSQTDDCFIDYAAFAKWLGADASINQVIHAGIRGGVHLHLAWVTGNPAYLQR